jgi:hypothetical protein
MLAVDLWLIVTDYPAHTELGVDPDLCQLAPCRFALHKTRGKADERCKKPAQERFE